MASIARRIGMGSFYSFFQNFLTIILGAASTILVIRELGTYQYGIVILAISIATGLNIFLDFGIGNVIVADVASNIGENKIDKAKNLLKSYAKLEIFLGLFLSVVVLLVSFYAEKKYSKEVTALVRIASLMILLNSVKNIYVIIFHSFSQFKFLALLYGIESVSRFLFVLLFVVLMNGGTPSVMITYLLSPFIAMIVLTPPLFVCIKKMRDVPVFKTAILWNTVKGHGKFQIILNFSESLLETLRVWIIQYFSGVNAVAVFQVAMRFSGYLSQLVFSATGPLLSVLSEELARDKENVKKTIIQISKYLTWVSVVTMVLAWLFTPAVFHIFFGSKYDESIPVIKWFLLAYLIGGVNILMKPLFFALKEQKILLKTDIIPSFATYPIAAFLTFLYGPIGFAVPMGSYLSFFLRYFYLSKTEFNFKIKVRDFLAWRKEDLFLFKRVYSSAKRRIDFTRNNF